MDNPALSESEFRRQVVDLADVYGWEHVGFRPAQTAHGWRTPGTGTMARGWPDLVLVRRARLLFVELKGTGGRVDPEQVRVLDVLRRVAGAEVFIWYPSDLDEVIDELSGGAS